MKKRTISWKRITAKIPNDRWSTITLVFATLTIVAIYALNIWLARPTAPAPDRAFATTTVDDPSPPQPPEGHDEAETSPVTTPPPTDPPTEETDPAEPETDPTEPETEPETPPAEPETEPADPETQPAEPETQPAEPKTEPETETQPTQPEEPEPPAPEWLGEARDVLTQFLSATSDEERLGDILAPDRFREMLALDRRNESAPADALSAADFLATDLTADLHDNGIFLMIHHGGEAEPANATPHRTFAFFRQTDAGLKLDAETFHQSRHRTFADFIARPQPGVSRVFRVFITEDPAPGSRISENHRAYQIADFADPAAQVRIRVTNASPAGQILTQASFTTEPIASRTMRAATVELRWTDHPEHSIIELSKFICWDFLGLQTETR